MFGNDNAGLLRGRGVDYPGGADEESGRLPRAAVGAGAGDVGRYCLGHAPYGHTG